MRSLQAEVRRLREGLRDLQQQEIAPLREELAQLRQLVAGLQAQTEGKA